MDLELDPEQQQLRDASRRLLARRLDALVERLPEPPAHDPAQALDDARALGWLGLALPEKVGGAGGFGDLALLHEELGRGLAPSLVTTVGLAARLVLHTDPSSPLLEQLCSGEARVASSSSLSAVRLTFGAGGPRLDGTIPHVVDARSVTHLLVPATVEDGVRLVLVPVSAAGLGLVELETGCDVRACSAVLEGVVADEVLAGDAGPALDLVRTEATVLAAARALGGGRAVLERTVAHVSTRHQFGRAIGTFQAVQHQLADVATALDAAGLAVARAAWAVDAGQTDAVAAAAVAGLAAQEAFRQATLVAHQLHGGMGFVLDSPLHLWSARAVADPTAPVGRRQLLDALAGELRTVPPHR